MTAERDSPPPKDASRTGARSEVDDQDEGSDVSDRVGRRASQSRIGHPEVKGWPHALPSWAHSIRSPAGTLRRSRIPVLAEGRHTLDWSKTLRAWARHGESGWPVYWRPYFRRPGRTVVLWDVSGSMSHYVPLYLPWLYQWAKTPEVGIFAFGTRVVDVTARFQHRPFADVAEALSSVDVFGAGTAIGDAIGIWQHTWGQRWLSSSTSVLIVSDGWDVGAPDLLATSLSALRSRARRMAWIHPLMATPGFEPKTRALKVAVRFIDLMVPGGTPNALLELPLRLR